MLRAEAAELSLLGSGRRVAEDVEVEGATVLPWPRRCRGQSGSREVGSVDRRGKGEGVGPEPQLSPLSSALL